MNGTQGEVNGRNEDETESQQDVTLPDAPQQPIESELAPTSTSAELQLESTPAEPPTPAKKNPGLGFVE